MIKQMVKGICQILIVSLIISIIVLLFACSNFDFLGMVFSKDRIEAKAIQITKNDSDDIGKVLSISNWVSKNINYSTEQKCKKCFSSYENLLKMCGACGEKAELVSAMLNSIGIKTVTVRTSGEDHVWNEVYVENRWVFLDASENTGVKNFGMEKMDFERIYQKNLSYVEIYSDDGFVYDVTKDYTNTRRINFLIQDNQGTPINLTRITLKGHALNPPKVSTSCITDSDGKCSVELGGYNYTVVVEKYFIVLREMNISVEENLEPETLFIKSDFNPDNFLFIVLLLFMAFFLKK